MTKRPNRARVLVTGRLVNAAHGVERLTARALDALGATPSSDVEATVPDDSPAVEDADPNIRAVQKARRAAVVAGDQELADHLTEVETQLRRQAPRTSESLLPSYRSGQGQDGLEDIRKRLLANTPRPGPSDRD